MSAIAEGDLFQIQVVGVAAGQEIRNVMWYQVDQLLGTIDSAEICEVFQTQWRLLVCPVLSDEYAVVQYVLRRFYGLYVPTSTPPAPLRVNLRFNTTDFILGDAGDDGQVAGACLPTYAAAGYRRVSGGQGTTVYVPTRHIDATPLLEKQFRSSTRLGPLPETYTEAADPNVLTAAAVTALEDIFDDLMTINVVNGGNSANLDNVIVSEWLNGFPRPNSLGINTIPYSVAVQIVTDTFLSPYVTSQVSRKQKLTGA